MEREEAIQILADLIDSPFLHTWEKQNKALHMAIEALSSDTVSREEYEEVKAYMDTLVDAFIEDGEELAELVNVVRCKDCRHRDLFSCPLADNDFQKDDDFCSWGERKEENINMRIYISGAMAKRPDTYKEEFAKAEKEITEKGYTVINPAWLPKGLDRNRYMPICMAMLDAADAIYMMDGWEESKGARLEKAYAEYQDKLVLYERSEDGAED